MDTPIIRTERLLLRSFERADAGDVFAYASNPNVSRFTTWQTHRTIASSESFIDWAMNRPDGYTWAIRLINEPPVIGAIDFDLTTETDAEFHYVLSEPFWNRGLMTEAARALLEWGLKSHPAVRRISTSAMSQNTASLRVMEKCGLRFSRTRFVKWEKFAESVEETEYVLLRGK
jgi:ribosomal-protein-alanine N-acetyltransferase